MPILRQEDRDAVQARFEEELERNVSLTLYTQSNLGGLFIPGRECQTCGPTQELLQEVADLSDKIELRVVDFHANSAEASEKGIAQIPAIVISADGGENARYYGLPSGYEFSVLLDAIASASGGLAVLSAETTERIRALKDEVHIQVFVTPN